MAVKHLTDAEIQDYLDGNLKQEHVFIVTQHLEACELCQKELHQYKILYSELKSDIDINLSPNFANTVSAKLRKESPDSASRRHCRCT